MGLGEGALIDLHSSTQKPMHARLRLRVRMYENLGTGTILKLFVNDTYIAWE